MSSDGRYKKDTQYLRVEDGGLAKSRGRPRKDRFLRAEVLELEADLEPLWVKVVGPHGAPSESWRRIGRGDTTPPSRTWSERMLEARDVDAELADVLAILEAKKAWLIRVWQRRHTPPAMRAQSQTSTANRAA